MKEILILIVLFIYLTGPAGILFVMFIPAFLIYCFIGGIGGGGGYSSASDYINLYSDHHEYEPEDDEWGEANTDGWFRPHDFDDDW